MSTRRLCYLSDERGPPACRRAYSARKGTTTFASTDSVRQSGFIQQNAERRVSGLGKHLSRGYNDRIIGSGSAQAPVAERPRSAPA